MFKWFALLETKWNLIFLCKQTFKKSWTKKQSNFINDRIVSCNPTSQLEWGTFWLIRMEYLFWHVYKNSLMQKCAVCTTIRVADIRFVKHEIIHYDTDTHTGEKLLERVVYFDFVFVRALCVFMIKRNILDILVNYSFMLLLWHHAEFFIKSICLVYDARLMSANIV